VELINVIGLVVICAGAVAAIAGNVALMASLNHQRQVEAAVFWRRAGIMLAGLVATTGGVLLQSA
jgi:hypothetical protein